MRATAVAKKTIRRQATPTGRSSVPRKKASKQTQGGNQKEMAFTARLDPNVAYHPSMVAQLRKMGITLEVANKRRNKVPITIRLDADVLEALRAMGDGWQPKTNDLLRKWLGLPERD